MAPNGQTGMRLAYDDGDDVSLTGSESSIEDNYPQNNKMAEHGAENVMLVNERKRKANYDGESELLNRRKRAQLPRIKTEPLEEETTIQAPGVSPITPADAVITPAPHALVNTAVQPVFQNMPESPDHAHIYHWLSMQERDAVANMPQTPSAVGISHASLARVAGDQASDHAHAQEQHEAALKTQFLDTFAAAGVPTDLITDDVSTKMVHAIAGMLTSVVSYQQTSIQEAMANNQYLVAVNQRLEAELHTTHAGLRNLEDAFNRFQKRSTQREISKQLKEIQQNITKLREPDVTIQTLSEQVEEFEGHQRVQDQKIDEFKTKCAKELELLTKVRKEFSREAKDKKKERKDDLRDLERKVDGLEEKLQHAKEDIEASHGNLFHHACAAAGACDEMEKEVKILQEQYVIAEQELSVLREHVTGLAAENDENWKAQEWKNGALSAGLKGLRACWP